MEENTYMEISEKKTSKLGYLILFVLFVFLVAIGQTVFSDIKKIPDRPLSPSYCINNYIRNLENIRYNSNCDQFNDTDKKFELNILTKELDPYVIKISNLNQELSNKQNQLSSNEKSLNNLFQEYNISLQETMANENALLNKPFIKNEILSRQATNENLKSEIAKLTIERSSIISQTSSLINKLDLAYSEAKEYYESKMGGYYLKIFLLKLLFVLPFFALFLYLYLKFKRKDSPYTIIITSIFFASTILVLQTVFVFLYEILPKTWFIKLFELFMSIAAMKYIIYYGSIILVIVVLGGIVFFIQKRVYDPKRVALRHLKDNKCPKCSVNLKLSETFCPQCGTQIKKKCNGCGSSRYINLKHCPSCGSLDEAPVVNEEVTNITNSQ